MNYSSQNHFYREKKKEKLVASVKKIINSCIWSKPANNRAAKAKLQFAWLTAFIS
jgi:hypothetical protein